MTVGERSMALAHAPLLELNDLTKHYAIRSGVFGRARGAVHAVDEVSFAIAEGETLGLVGESGGGKSTLGKTVLRLVEPTAGTIAWRGQRIDQLKGRAMRPYRREMQAVFQDPYASLNPRMRVVDIVGEAPVAHGVIGAKAKVEYVGLQLNRVGLDPTLMRRFPHQFSGGQRARIGIARALAVKPEFLVCDESVAALDVSIQAQVLNLFMDLRTALNLTYLFISHDLGVVEHISDRVVIMYLGRVVETAAAAELFAGANHPYTRALLAEIPSLRVKKRDFMVVKGEIPSPLNPPSGCHFHPRCPRAMARCRVEPPRLQPVAAGHWSACHLNDGQA